MFEELFAQLVLADAADDDPAAALGLGQLVSADRHIQRRSAWLLGTGQKIKKRLADAYDSELMFSHNGAD